MYYFGALELHPKLKIRSPPQQGAGTEKLQEDRKTISIEYPVMDRANFDEGK